MKSYDLIYFMGDSWTFALGQAEDIDQTVNLENRWTRIVSKYFDLSEVNKSKAGCGNFFIFKTVIEDIPQLIGKGLNPLVVISYSDPNRKEFYIKNRDIYLSINHEDFDVEFHKEFLTSHYSSIVQNQETILYMASLQNFLQNKKIDYVENFAFTNILDHPLLDRSRLLDKTLLDIAEDEGRLLMPDKINYGHANVLGNKKIADKIINQIKIHYG